MPKLQSVRPASDSGVTSVYLYIRIGLEKQENCKCFLVQSRSICLGLQKNSLIETFLLSTHTISFG